MRPSPPNPPLPSAVQCGHRIRSNGEKMMQNDAFVAANGGKSEQIWCTGLPRTLRPVLPPPVSAKFGGQPLEEFSVLGGLRRRGHREPQIRTSLSKLAVKTRTRNEAQIPGSKTGPMVGSRQSGPPGPVPKIRAPISGPDSGPQNEVRFQARNRFPRSARTVGTPA